MSEPPASPPRPLEVWGPVATMGWGALLTLLVFVGVQGVVVSLLVLTVPQVVDRGVELDGDLAGLAILASAGVGLTAIAGAAGLARGAPVADYLALRWP
ncbi:MAG: hypothetical protein ACRD0X_05590, partial [Thermoanaerobaculia bacterium]